MKLTIATPLRHILLLFLALALHGPVTAEPTQTIEPAELLAQLLEYKNEDYLINYEAVSVEEKLGKGTLSLSEAHARWSALLERAKQNGENVRALQQYQEVESDLLDKIYAMCDLVRKQQGRIQTLVNVSELELEKGRDASEEETAGQKQALVEYKSVRKHVDELFTI